MRLLHLGSGFRPWRRGGLVAYVEDLMAEQLRRGHEVAYFFSGRHYPFPGGPRLNRWQHGGVSMFEVVNSPLFDHGRQPELEVAEPGIEAMLERVLAETRPDAVHVQELAGLPSSVLDVVRDHGAPAVVTLQDYFPLCSTFKLLDADGRVCLRREIGADCVRTVAADERDPALLIEWSMVYRVAGLPFLRKLNPVRRDDRLKRLARPIARAAARRRTRRTPADLSPGAFQRRRDLNVERLNRAERLIAMSHRVAEIYAQLGVEAGRLRTMQLTLAHIERLQPRPRVAAPGEPLTFATLAGLDSEAKGARLLLDAMRTLSAQVAAGRLRLLVFGWADAAFAEEAEAVAGIEIRPPFGARELDSTLDEVDVGIVASTWEEAYGYVGVEFLAKGIPVIANAIGGMVDYTRDGETGWLNHSCSAAELTRIMGELAERPQRVAELAEKVRAARARIVKPMARHADEMDAVYAESIAARAAARSAAAGSGV